MKKLTRRELFKRTAQAGIGGAALTVGLTPVPRERVILAGSRVGKSFPGLYPRWTPEVHLPLGVPPPDETWFKSGLEECERLLKEATKDWE